MTNSTLLRNLRVIALKLSKLFKIEFPAILLPKIKFKRDYDRDRAYMGASSLILYPLLARVH